MEGLESDFGEKWNEIDEELRSKFVLNSPTTDLCHTKRRGTGADRRTLSSRARRTAMAGDSLQRRVGMKTVDETKSEGYRIGQAENTGPPTSEDRAPCVERTNQLQVRKGQMRHVRDTVDDSLEVLDML